MTGKRAGIGVASQHWKAKRQRPALLLSQPQACTGCYRSISLDTAFFAWLAQGATEHCAPSQHCAHLLHVILHALCGLEPSGSISCSGSAARQPDSGPKACARREQAVQTAERPGNAWHWKRAFTPYIGTWKKRGLVQSFVHACQMQAEGTWERGVMMDLGAEVIVGKWQDGGWQPCGCL